MGELFNKTVTEKQLEANRLNALKSTGPQDPEAKAKVSRNAVRHGLCGRFHVLAGELQELFDNLFEQFMKDEKPVGSAEVELVRRMAEYTWMRDRASRFVESCYTMPEPSPEQRAAGRASIFLSPELERFLRHQAHFDRQFARASAELLRRRKERQLAENGIVSEKRAEACEARREKQQNHRDELHKVRHATAEITREAAQTRKATAELKRQHAEVQLWKQFDTPARPKVHKSAA
jgi:hypothetical protein